MLHAYELQIINWCSNDATLLAQMSARFIVELKKTYSSAQQDIIDIFLTACIKITRKTGFESCLIRFTLKHFTWCALKYREADFLIRRRRGQRRDGCQARDCLSRTLQLRLWDNSKCFNFAATKTSILKQDITTISRMFVPANPDEHEVFLTLTRP